MTSNQMPTRTIPHPPEVCMRSRRMVSHKVSLPVQSLMGLKLNRSSEIYFQIIKPIHLLCRALQVLSLCHTKVCMFKTLVQDSMNYLIWSATTKASQHSEIAQEFQLASLTPKIALTIVKMHHSSLASTLHL